LELLEKKYKEQLDETARTYISFATNGAAQMKKLILDLLEYSRVGTIKEDSSDTDMNEVMHTVLEILKHKIREAGAEVEVEKLPVLSNTSKTQMLQLMQNLLSNALKYHGDEKPRVKICATEEEGKWLFSVKDNGIGIDPKFQEKVFIIFQRLHNKKEYSGTGIGLSICKKIVERHGGKIWVESQSGQGSTFYFSISSSKPFSAN
jgi:light-regulated signal transduction histidine kinase (bacteriophytochrome)